jgi:hypothetical protein
LEKATADTHLVYQMNPSELNLVGLL